MGLNWKEYNIDEAKLDPHTLYTLAQSAALVGVELRERRLEGVVLARHLGAEAREIVGASRENETTATR